MTGISYNYVFIGFYFIYESHSLVNISYSLLSQIAAYRVALQEGEIVGLRPYEPLHL